MSSEMCQLNKEIREENEEYVPHYHPFAPMPNWSYLCPFLEVADELFRFIPVLIDGKDMFRICVYGTLKDEETLDSLDVWICVIESSL